MNRRSFFGFSAGAAVAAPVVAAGSPAASEIMKLSLPPIDTSALRQSAAELAEISASVGRIRPFEWGSAKDRYVYRTGIPAIDALKSVSSVHKERMERRYTERG